MGNRRSRHLELVVVHGGRENWPMAERVRAVAARDLIAQLKPLK